MRASCKTSYWAEIRDSSANCAYNDHDGSRKNLNVTIKRVDGNQVPRTCRTRRTDAWARVLFSRAQTSLELHRVASSTLWQSLMALDYFVDLVYKVDQ